MIMEWIADIQTPTDDDRVSRGYIFVQQYDPEGHGKCMVVQQTPKDGVIDTSFTQDVVGTLVCES